MVASLEPWIVCRPAARTGIDATVHRVLDPLRLDSAPFLQRLRTLDLQAYGARAMPNWVFYDCTVVPGALFGFGRETPEGFVPISLMGVIPTVGREAELVTTLAAPDPDTARATIIEGARALGIDALTVVTQWDAPELDVWGTFGPWRLLTAWTPAHDDPRTLTFRVSPRAQRSQALTLPERSEYSLRSLQARIEAGEVVDL